MVVERGEERRKFGRRWWRDIRLVVRKHARIAGLTRIRHSEGRDKRVKSRLYECAAVSIAREYIRIELMLCLVTRLSHDPSTS